LDRGDTNSSYGRGGKRAKFGELSDNAEVKIYVSEKGRIFSESSGFGEGRGRLRGARRQQAPDEDDGSDRPYSVTPDKVHWSLSGDAVVGTQRFIHGTRHIRATVFSSGNERSCKLEVIFGKSNEEFRRYCSTAGSDPSACRRDNAGNWTGALLRQGRRGAYEVLSQEIRDAKCEISGGNVFAR
jgi:hypothetical protein